MSVCLFYLPQTFVINLILIKVISMSNEGEIFSYIKWRPPLSLWLNLFFGVQSNAVVLFLIDLKLSLGYMIEFNYWICALIHVLWLYVVFISFRKLSVISSNCNRMLNRKHGMENTTPKGDEEFQWLQSLRIEHWFDVHNIKIVGLKAVELNILVVNPKLNVSLKWFF